MRDHPRSARFLAFLVDGFVPLAAVCQANLLMRYLVIAIDSSGYVPELSEVTRTQSYFLVVLAGAVLGMEAVQRLGSTDRVRSLGMTATGWSYLTDEPALRAAARQERDRDRRARDRRGDHVPLRGRG